MCIPTITARFISSPLLFRLLIYRSITKHVSYLLQGIATNTHDTATIFLVRLQLTGVVLCICTVRVLLLFLNYIELF